MSAAHDILLALAYVSRVSEPGLVCERFVESLREIEGRYDFSCVDSPPEGVSGERVFLISTLRRSYGCAVLAAGSELDETERSALRNSFQLLAVLLENREHEQALRSKYHSLQREVSQEKSTVRAVLDTLPVGVWLTDASGLILMGNVAGEKIWGGVRHVGPEQYDEYRAFWTDTGKPVTRHDWPVMRALGTGTSVVDEEMRIEGFDGVRRIVLVSAAPIVDDAQQVIGAVVVNRDVTEIKQAEREKAGLYDQVLQLQKLESIGRLAGGVAHDFNNALGVILGYTEMLLERVMPGEPHRAELQEIQNAASRSAQLTRQLLAFARREPVLLQVLDMNHVIEGMLKMLQRIIGEDIDLVWKPGPEASLVTMDPSQLDQVLVNLCANSRDAISSVGKIFIETSIAVLDDAYCAYHPGPSPGEFVLLEVTDTGKGMDKATLERVFEPFFTTKGMGEGTGLGLATVYGIAQQNRGIVNVYSEPGMGTTFKIYLPRFQGERQIDVAPPRPAESSKGETILVAEDEPAILDLTRTLLEAAGYRVLAAGGGLEALELAKAHAGEVNLLITDVVMPGMDGPELAEEISAVFPGIKRLFMSGYAADVISQHGYLDPEAGFIQKPFSRERLLVGVRTALEKS